MTAPDTRPVQSLILVLTGMTAFGFVDNFVGLIAREAGLWQFHATRAAVVLPSLLILARFFGKSVRPLRPGGVAGRSLAIAAAMMIYFGSLAVLPIAQVVAGLFTAPVFVLVFSALFRSVRVGPMRWAAAAVGFAGLLLVIQPKPGALSVLTFLPVLAGALYAVSNLATRSWCEGETAIGLTFWSFFAMGCLGVGGIAVVALAGDPSATAFALRPLVPPTPAFLSLILLQSVGSITGIFCVIRAYQLGEATYVSIYEYALIVSATLWAWALWGTAPDPLSVAGMALIVASGVVIAVRSR